MNAIEENLIGYAMGALDASDQKEVERYLEEHPEAVLQLQKIQAALTPLAADRDSEIEPPKGLVLNTLAHIAENQCQSTLPSAPEILSYSGGARSWWRRADVIAACFLLILMGGVGATWIINGWRDSDQAQCQANLHEVHSAMVTYAQNQPGNGFPRVAKEGPLAFAGSYVPILQDSGVLNASVSISCPTHGRRGPDGSTRDDLKRLYRENPDRYRRKIREIGGSYAYCLGYRQNGQLHELCLNSGHGALPLLADSPPFRAPALGLNGNSLNHQGRGQNVLFVDGSVRFSSGRGAGVGGDDIYLNRQNKVKAGVSLHDSVLGVSEASPLQY